MTHLRLTVALSLASTACGALLSLDEGTPGGAETSSSGSTGSSGVPGSSDAGSSTSGGGPLDKGTPARLFSGEFNSCILSDTGVLACWGINGSGQLAQGGPVGLGSNVPVRVLGAPSNVSSLGIGRSALCLVADGSLSCAGGNQFGELGDGSPGRTELAVLASLSDVRSVANGGNTTCALRNDRSVWCWGANDRMQAGVADAQNIVSAPNPVVTSLSVERIAVSDGFACAAAAHSVGCWGKNINNRLGQAGDTELMTHVPIAVGGIDGTVNSLSLGTNHACAIVDGAARCWGSNSFGELGITTGSIPSDGAVTPTGMDSGITSLSAGFGFTCAVQNGSLFCWGWNSKGQLGIGSNEQFDRPHAVDVGGTVAEVSCSYMHACALRSDGEVLCWGSNMAGELGAGIVLNEANTPQRVLWDEL